MKKKLICIQFYDFLLILIMPIIIIKITIILTKFYIISIKIYYNLEIVIYRFYKVINIKNYLSFFNKKLYKLEFINYYT